MTLFHAFLHFMVNNEGLANRKLVTLNMNIEFRKEELKTVRRVSKFLRLFTVCIFNSNNLLFCC